MKPTNSENLDELADSDEKEEQIEEEFKLVEEHDWNEGDDVVLCVGELVTGVGGARRRSSVQKYLSGLF